MTEPTTEALAMFKVMLAAKPEHIGGLSKSSFGEWCENVVAAGYVLAEARASLDVERLKIAYGRTSIHVERFWEHVAAEYARLTAEAER